MASTKPNGKDPSQLGELERLLLEMRDSFRFHQNEIRRKYKITANEMEIIFFISQLGPQRMKSIGEKFNIKFSTLTSLVDKIEKLNLVRRVNSKEDRRSILVTITKKGHRMLGEYDGHALVMADKIREGSAKTKLKTFTDTLGMVIHLPEE